jgi:hypothetical protein
MLCIKTHPLNNPITLIILPILNTEYREITFLAPEHKASMWKKAELEHGLCPKA